VVDNSWDSYYLASSAIITVGLQFIGWAMAVVMKTETFYDLFGGINFIIIALITLLFKDEYSDRQAIVTSLVCVSRAALAGFLAFRVFSREGDARFEVAKNSPSKMLVFWGFQAVWVFCVSLPVIFINGSNYNPDIGAGDIAGFTMIGIGLACETISDVQKYQFRNDKSNAGRVCNVGLWRYSRHPNYFGEVFLWWGVFTAGTAVFSEDNPGWVSVLSPLVTMSLLLFVSGIPMAEGANLKRFYKTPESAEIYEEYFESTSPLIPCVPACYKALPSVVKLLCCFELPSYRYKGEHNVLEDGLNDATTPPAKGGKQDSADVEVPVASHVKDCINC